MIRNALVAGVLVVLVIVPITLTFLLSGENEDAARREDDSSCPVVVSVRAEGVAGDGIGGQESDFSALVAALDDESAAPASGPTSERPRVVVPVFKGFENPRYQMYDALIAKCVTEFNANPAAWAGSTPGQAAKIGKITAAQVKAHMIQETGGGDVNSRAAWKADPLQVNVPGDWNPYKRYLGIREPRRRNEGSVAKNLKAGIMLLARKGFGRAGQPAANSPKGTFDGWKTALQRYNGRSDKAADGRTYRDAYAERIIKRATKPSSETPIQIPTKKK